MQKSLIKFRGRSLVIYTRDEADKSVVAEIFKLEEYRICAAVIEKAKFAIADVGAHAGFFTLYAKAINPAVEVAALEPEANNLIFLKKHLNENNISGVRIVAGALARASGEGVLKLSPDSHNHELLLSKRGKLNEGEIPVKVYSLADLIKFSQSGKLALIKMDIEGGEYEVFAGATPEDFGNIGAIIMEYHNYGQNNYEWIERKMREHGFGVRIFPSKFDKRMGFLWAVNKRVKF
ncbi:MAG: FkbM family methyltransferase [Candidatus Magasanikbacteria bacterium]|nr:FkbM family methyltransferase [Candidatus Magasanikbacteria bacterium]